MEQEYKDIKNDEIDLIEIFSTIWKKRWRIVIYSGIFTCLLLFIFLCSFFILQQNKTQNYNLAFSLHFDGISKKQYPNGEKFSLNNIINSDVLYRVYNKNKLQGFLAFDQFQRGISIFQKNNRMELLNKYYSSLIVSSKNSPETVTEMLNKYKTDEENILNDTNYQLLFDEELAGGKLPEELVSKVLNEILQTWVEYEEETKGIARHKVAIPSYGILNDKEIKSNSGLFNIKILEQVSQSINTVYKKLVNLPGAEILSVNYNNEQVKLIDVFNRNKLIFDFEINPLTEQVRQSRDNNELSTYYIQQKITELRQKQEKLTEEKALYYTLITEYLSSNKTYLKAGTATTSQNEQTALPVTSIDSNVFNSIKDFTEQNSRDKFIQNLSKKYLEIGTDLIKCNSELAFQKSLLSESNTKENNSNLIINTENILNIFSKLKTLLHIENLFYDKLNSNLIPKSGFYTIKFFSIMDNAQFSNKKLALVFAVVWMLGEMLIILLTTAFAGRKNSKIQ